jgi:predicted methyltransferase
MRRSFLLAAVAVMSLLSAGCMAGMGASPAPTPADYASALAAATRPADDRARDGARHTAETLAFARVRPGQKVADMIIGGGYFTRVFSAAVGPGGRVTAWQPAEFIAFQASYGDSLTAVDALANVDAIRSPMAAPDFPAGLDLVFTAQNYHDLHLNIAPADTASRVNAAVFAALKPGGLYVVIDHHAVAGAPMTSADTVTAW